MKKFDFYDDSNEDCDGWWDRSYYSIDPDVRVSSFREILDSVITLQDKVLLNQLPKHKHVLQDTEWGYVFSRSGYFNPHNMQEDIEKLGYAITVDGINVFDYNFDYEGYTKDYKHIAKIANKYNSDKDFISKLGELLSDCGIEGEVMDSFINLIHIREKVVDVLPFLSNK